MGQNKAVLADSCFRFRPPGQEGHKVTGPSDVKLQPVLTGGPGRGRARGRRGARTKGLAHRPRRPPRAPGSQTTSGIHCCGLPKGEERRRGEWGGQGGASPRPPLRLVPSPGTQPSPAGSPSPSRGRPGNADAKAPPARAGTRVRLASSDSSMASAGH